MPAINLKYYYPDCYTKDCHVEVTDEIYEALESMRKEEAARYERTRYHKAYYSLDLDDDIELEAIHKPSTPEDILFAKWQSDELQKALAMLPKRQSSRIKARYINGRSNAEIAAHENAQPVAVNMDIKRGLKRFRVLLHDLE